VITGTQIVIYDVGTILESYSGLLRVGELAAWHAGTSIMFLTILVARYPSLTFRALAVLLIAALVGAILLTGRRKMLMTIVIFFAFQWILLALLRRGLTKGTVTLLALVSSGTLVFSLFGHEQRDTEQALYAERGLTVFESVDDRLTTTKDLLSSALQRSGGIGLGTGIAGQGARYAGGSGSAWAVGGSSEAGIGMIMVELGLVGFIASLWLLYRIGYRVLQGLFALARPGNDSMLFYAVSFVAILVANVATFSVATQLFGDFMVLITLGLVAGALFALLNLGLLQRRLDVLAQVHGGKVG
jgi:hypothetical protein